MTKAKKSGFIVQFAQRNKERVKIHWSSRGWVWLLTRLPLRQFHHGVSPQFSSQAPLRGRRYSPLVPLLLAGPLPSPAQAKQQGALNHPLPKPSPWQTLANQNPVPETSPSSCHKEKHPRQRLGGESKHIDPTKSHSLHAFVGSNNSSKSALSSTTTRSPAGKPLCCLLLFQLIRSLGWIHKLPHWFSGTALTQDFKLRGQGREALQN